ncbi:SIS domain-containing protein [Candidatus Bathyarchaeota archaeon]|nr:SIS domain-containing protein [Candidatus Bathyarchaeota archaeon]
MVPWDGRGALGGGGGFPHRMIMEIYEQPKALEDTMVKEDDEVRRVAEIIDQRRCELIYITGSGTSYHAGLAGGYALSTLTGMITSTIPASEFESWIPPSIPRRSLLLAISQSGESSDILEAAKAASGRGIMVVALTNTPGSPLAEVSDHVLLTHAGREYAVAATKTYTAQLSILYMLSLELARLTGLAPWSVEELRASLSSTPRLAREALMMNDKPIEGLAYRFRQSNYFFLLGSGPNYATALEGALKLKEACNIYAEGFAAREFLHGPIQLISGGTPSIFIAAGEDVKRLMRLALSIKGFGAPLIPVSDRPEGLSAVSQEVVRVPGGLPGIFSPIIFIIPLQLFAYYGSKARGLDPDRPEKLRKVVR